MNSVDFRIDGRNWRADLSQPQDISIALQFNGPQPHCFGAPAAQATVYAVGSFEGDVRRNGSCNCTSHMLTPHCNGTHTECVGHITYERVSVRDVTIESLLLARLVSVQPVPSPRTADANDVVITLEALQSACKAESLAHCQALILRTLPNGPEKIARDYDAGDYPAYFEPEAMHWLTDQGIEHLLVDLPSVDRMADEGRLLAHRMFWGMPPGATSLTQASRPQATLTELIYVKPGILDGLYLLNLQVAPFAADAAPSRPLLYPLASI